MAGYSAEEKVRKVIVVGVATKNSKGVASIYDDKIDDKGEAIPDNGDWSGVKIKPYQLRVKPNVTLDDGTAKRKSTLHFNVNIPANFFSAEKFIASPRYQIGDVLHAKLTGYGSEQGYIDLNVEGRGGGGEGGGGDLEGCAKWS